jgi:hypothetical protein
LDGDTGDANAAGSVIAVGEAATITDSAFFSAASFWTAAGWTAAGVPATSLTRDKISTVGGISRCVSTAVAIAGADTAMGSFATGVADAGDPESAAPSASFEGSQIGHAFAAGGISPPHSGQIQ